MGEIPRSTLRRAPSCCARCGGSACSRSGSAQLKRNLQVHGLIHLSIGGEGVAAAVCGQLRDDDAVYSGHRAHGHAIAKGAPINRVMAELMGRDDGPLPRPRRLDAPGRRRARVHGRHRRRRRQPSAGARDARSRSICAGTDQVTVVFFGDGAVQAGHFNESINLAALWELPLIFVCENNGFAEFTSREEHSTIERVSDVVAPYGFERETVDGSDVAGGVRRVRRFLTEARAGQGSVPARVPDLPPARPLRGRPGEVPRRRWPSRSGPSATRSPRLTERAIEQGWIDEATRRTRSSGRRAPRSRPRSRFARDSPFPDPEIAAGRWSYAREPETTFVEAITQDARHARCARTSG